HVEVGGVLGAVADAGGAGGGDDVGRDAVDADLVLGKLEGEGLGEDGDAALGGAVDGEARSGAQGLDRGDIDDAAAAPAFDHHRRHGLAAEQGALEVGADDRVHAALVQFEEG